MTTKTIETNQFLKALAALVATVVVTAGLMLVSATTPAHASTTYTVNVLGDQADLKLNDNPNLCDVNQLFGGPQCTLRAAIHSFLDTAIEIEGAATAGVKVKGNFLGTVASGDFGRGGEGVRIGSDGNTVGGSGPATSSPTTSVAVWCSTRTATRCRATS